MRDMGLSITVAEYADLTMVQYTPPNWRGHCRAQHLVHLADVPLIRLRTEELCKAFLHTW